MDAPAHPRHDFLAQLFQMDPAAFDLLGDGDGAIGGAIGGLPPPYFGAGTALASQGAVMMDFPTPAGTQAMCSIFPPLQRRSGGAKLPLLDAAPLAGPRPPARQPREPREAASTSGSEREWEPPEAAGSRVGRTSSDDSKLRVQSRGKAPAASANARRRFQKYKDKCEEQQRRLARLEAELAAARKAQRAVEAHAEVLEKALMKSATENAESQTRANPSFTPSRGWAGFDPRGAIVLDQICRQPMRLTPAEVKRLTLADIAKLWREYVAGIRGCLQQLGSDKAEATAEAQPHHPALAKLQALLDERHGLLSYVAAQHPHLIYHLQRSDLSTDPPTQPARPPPAFHTGVLRKVKVRREQGDRLVAFRNSYLQAIGFGSGKLARLQGQLGGLDTTPRESLSASAYILWAEGARLLSEAVEDIHLQHARMHFELYHGSMALTPLQAGRMLVESFPFLPDLPALVRELAAEKRAPSSEELLAAGAARYAEQQGAAAIEVPPEPYVPVAEKIEDLLRKLKLGGSPL